MLVVDGDGWRAEVHRDNGRVQTRAHGQVAGGEQLAHLQIVQLVHHHVIAGRIVHQVAQVERHHTVIFVVAVDTGTGGKRQHLVTAVQHAVHHVGKGFLVRRLGRAEAFIERRKFTQGNGDGFLLCRHVQPVLYRVAGLETVILMIHQPGGVHTVLHFGGVDFAALHHVEADRFTQDQRVAVAEDIVRQLVKLRILERPDAVADHKQRLFRHKGAKRMFKLRHAVQVDEERAAHLNNGVIAGQQTHEIGKALRDGDVAQLAGVGHARKQHLMLVAATQDFLHAPHHARSVVVLFHLAVERVAHHRAVQ